MRAVGYMWRAEVSFRIQIAILAFTLFLAWGLEISRTDFLIIMFAIGVVLAVEAVNTALERIGDTINQAPDPRVAHIKDLGSAASFLIGIATFLVWCEVFIPPLIAFL